MPVKKGSSNGVFADPRMGLQQRRAQMRQLMRVVVRRIRRGERGLASAGRLQRLRHMHDMLADEIGRLDRAIDALEDHGTPHQIRVPGSGERIRLYRRKRR